MKILFAPLGSRGDVQPLINLARELSKRGHQCSFCISPDFYEWIEKDNFEFLPFGPPFRQELENISNVLTKNPLKLLKTFKNKLSYIYREQFKVILENKKGVDLIIGSGFQLIADSVAEKIGVPYRLVAYCPQVLPSKYYPPYTIPFNIYSQNLNNFLWWISKKVLNFLFLNIVNDVRKEFSMSKRNGIYEQLNKTHTWLAADSIIAPAPKDFLGSCLQSGAWVLPSNSILPSYIETFIKQNQNNKIVYIGFGSMTDPFPNKTMDIILNAIKEVNCSAIISRGWANLNYENIPNNCLMIDDVSHDVLFARVDAIIHHGGAGTTAVALRSGKPQWIIPHIADQYYWGYRTWEAKIAPYPLAKNKITSTKMAKGILCLLGEQELKKNANDIKDEIKGYNILSDVVNHVENLKNL